MGTAKTAGKRQLAGTRVGIPPRQMDFDLAPYEADRYFFGDNAFATLFLATLSVFFPPGEQYFVESVRRFRHTVDDKDLQDRIAGFIGQESIHGREHERLNAIFSEMGIRTEIPESMVKFGLTILERLSAEQQLACTCFMEHFTALLAEELLTDDRLRRAMSEETRNLWMWHALEELEHKSVAYDVWEKVSGKRYQRVIAGPLVGVVLVPMIVGSMAGLLLTDRQLPRLRSNLRGANMLFHPTRGFVGRIVPKLPMFARRRFHPDQHNTEKLVKRWRETLFGAEGELNDALRNREATAVA